MLFVGKCDVETDGAAAVFVGATVGRFHDAWAAAGDDGVAVFGEEFAELARLFVIAIFFGKASGAEDGDALGEGADDFEAV